MPTAAGYLDHRHPIEAICRGLDCRHATMLDLERLVAAGKGNVPLNSLRFRCTACGHRGSVNFIVHGRPFEPPGQ